MHTFRLRKLLGMLCLLTGLVLVGGSLGLNALQHWEKQRLVREFRQQRTEEDFGEAGSAATAALFDSSENHSAGEDPASGDEGIALGDGLLGILRIPAIDSEEPVREGVSKSVLHAALGHEPGTSLPGEKGNCVLAGHRNYSFGSMFNRLNELEIGDALYFDSREGTFAYRVREIRIVEPEALEILDPTEEEILTLYTCTPIYIATHRLVVLAERTE